MESVDVWNDCCALIDDWKLAVDDMDTSRCSKYEGDSSGPVGARGVGSPGVTVASDEAETPDLALRRESPEIVLATEPAVIVAS